MEFHLIFKRLLTGRELSKFTWRIVLTQLERAWKQGCQLLISSSSFLFLIQCLSLPYDRNFIMFLDLVVICFFFSTYCWIATTSFFMHVCQFVIDIIERESHFFKFLFKFMWYYLWSTFFYWVCCLGNFFFPFFMLTVLLWSAIEFFFWVFKCCRNIFLTCLSICDRFYWKGKQSFFLFFKKSLYDII